MKSRSAALLLMSVSLCPWTPVRADVVTDWNAVALACAYGNFPPKRPTPSGIFDVALVQAAMHDAVQAIQRRFEPYAFAPRTPVVEGSDEAAAAAAAYGVLSGLYGSDTPCLAAVETPATTYAGDRGLQVGSNAAASLLFHYRPTFELPVDPFVGSNQRGRWRPTPGVTQGANTSLTHTLPFTMLRPSQFRPQPPPPLTSARYAADFNEVKALGALDGSSRTAEQHDLAMFWNINPITMWYAALRDIADAHTTDPGDSARLLALASFAAADALISVFEAKYHYNYWRPVTAVHEGDDDNNPDTVGDANWAPLLGTPPYPEYTSGFNGLAGAFTKTLELFFGTDEFAFSMRSDNPAAVVNPRSYTRFSEASDEVVEVRILHGVHFRTADVVGRRQGRLAASWAFNHFLRPTAD